MPAKAPTQSTRLIYLRVAPRQRADRDGRQLALPGRGLIQVTSWVNYEACGALSAFWFWSSNGLNKLADAGRFEAITRGINGGLNGRRADRSAEAAREGFGVLA